MYGFTQYVVAQVGIERLFRDDLDSPAQEIFKVEDETRRKPRAGGRTGIDEKVDITLGPSVAACDRAKDPDIVGAMSSGNLLDVVPLLAQKLLEARGVLFWTGVMLRHGITPTWFAALLEPDHPIIMPQPAAFSIILPELYANFPNDYVNRAA
jgi:hypothetical protein